MGKKKKTSKELISLLSLSVLEPILFSKVTWTFFNLSAIDFNYT